VKLFFLDRRLKIELMSNVASDYIPTMVLKYDRRSTKFILSPLFLDTLSTTFGVNGGSECGNEWGDEPNGGKDSNVNPILYCK